MFDTPHVKVAVWIFFLQFCLTSALVSSWKHGGSQRRVASVSLKLTGSNIDHLTNIDRVLCISDLHVDHNDNMEWLANHTFNEESEGITLQQSDLVVVAGDISHDIDRIEQALGYLQRQGSSILFVPGNHEAWLHSSELETGDSCEKLKRINEMCQDMGVHTNPVLVGNTEDRPHGLWVAPLQSWYDGTLSVENLGKEWEYSQVMMLGMRRTNIPSWMQRIFAMTLDGGLGSTLFDVGGRTFLRWVGATSESLMV